jgi:hypothetical protein
MTDENPIQLWIKIAQLVLGSGGLVGLVLVIWFNSRPTPSPATPSQAPPDNNVRTSETRPGPSERPIPEERPKDPSTPVAPVVPAVTPTADSARVPLVGTLRGQNEFEQALQYALGPVFIHFCQPNALHCEAFKEARERVASEFLDKAKLYVYLMNDDEARDIRIEASKMIGMNGDAPFWKACIAGKCLYQGPLETPAELERSITAEINVFNRRYK